MKNLHGPIACNSNLGANTLENESSGEQIGQGPIGTFAPGSELAGERKGSVPSSINDAPVTPAI